MIKKVIFTDLDGTLLDKKYSFESAKPAIEILKEQKIPLVIVTSKTRAEIEIYRKKLGNKHPFVSENGGGVFIPVGYFKDENLKKMVVSEKYKIIKLGIDYKKLVDALDKIEEKIKVRGFSDMTAKELVKHSGLSLREAKLAKKREFDEAFSLEHKKDEKELFRLIEKYNLNYTKGGLYYHILGDNDKGKAVQLLIDMFEKKLGKIESVGLGDSYNDKPMLKITNKSFFVDGPRDWNYIIIKLLGMNKKLVKQGESLYKNSLNILKTLQLGNGAILASPPKSRYPYVYPRDHSICILSFIDANEFLRARKGLEFVLKSQNKDGSFAQRLDKKGRDASYKPIQLDNTGLILYAFAKYIQKTKDSKFLKKYSKKIKKSVKYIESQLHKKNLFYTPNSIHEFPPFERGLEIWANAVCYAGLNELQDIGIKSKISLEKVKRAMNNYFWSGEYFIKNIRLRESSSVAKEIDASAYSVADFNIFEDENEKVKKTVKKIEKELWHKQLGGICRYERHIGRNNGGWGPWPHFTLMICRHFIRLGNKQKADKYLKWVLGVSYNGELPEHIALKRDFERWVNFYKRAGILRKDREIMLKNIRKHPMFKKHGIAYSVLPLGWPHAEFIRTWLLYKSEFL